ncbi:MAG TPA: heavy metal-associated domain-containing protein [Bdellovibrionota bacterium]|jgi:copper chaperone CopZ|nr:heavy metal-associated domain-containing protein [Bdellovibrionota bacterium]
MKTLKSLLKNNLVALALVGATLAGSAAHACAEHEAAAAHDSEASKFIADSKSASAKLTELQIPKVSCQACAYKIRKGLKPLPGVHQVEVDDTTKTLRFRCDKCDMNDVKAKLIEIGYPAAENT